MAKISRRTGMVRGHIGKDVYKVQKGQQIVTEWTPRSVPLGELEKESVDRMAKVGERYGLLPKPIRDMWNKGAGKYSVSAHIREKKQDFRKTQCGLKIIHHDHCYVNGESFYSACNGWCDKAGMDVPADFPPSSADKILYPHQPTILDWRWEKPRVGLKILVPSQPYYYTRELAELAAIARSTFSGKKKYASFVKDGVKKWRATEQFRARDQTVARAKITQKPPCEVWLWFDQVHVGPTLGDKYVPIDQLGKGVMTIVANIIGAPNRYCGKSDMYPELKGGWHLLTPKEIELFRAEGRLKSGPLVEASAEEDFNGGMLSGALISLDSVPVQLELNREGVPALLKKSGEYFKNLNQKKSQNK